MKAYCPSIAGVCEDGYPPNSEIPCIYWDGIYEVCLMKENFQKSFDAFKETRALIKGFDAFKETRALIKDYHERNQTPWAKSEEKPPSDLSSLPGGGQD